MARLRALTAGLLVFGAVCLWGGALAFVLCCIGAAGAEPPPTWDAADRAWAAWAYRTRG